MAWWSRKMLSRSAAAGGAGAIRVVGAFIFAGHGLGCGPAPRRSARLVLPKHIMGIYGRWMDRWERKLATRDTNRVVRPFEWGTDWLSSIGHPSIPAEVNGDGPHRLSRFAEQALAESE